MKKILVSFVLILIFTGCTNQGEISKDMDISNQYQVYGDFSNGIQFVHYVNDIIIKTTYSTDYSVKEWRITDNKTIRIELNIIENPSNVEMYIENMHADIFVEATRDYVDGIKQDTMDDRLHSGVQSGFYVSLKHSYEEVFSIEGYSKFLTEAWMFMWSGFGYGSQREVRLTEKNLVSYGVYGSEIVVIYDILLRDETGFLYKVFIRDVFIVSLNGEWIGRVETQMENAK